MSPRGRSWICALVLAGASSFAVAQGETDWADVEGRIDPISDLEIIETELMLADLESLEKRLPQLEKRAKTGGDKEAGITVGLINAALEELRNGRPHRGQRHREIEINRLALLVCVGREQRATAPRGRAVHEHIHARPVITNSREHARDRVGAGQLTWHDQRLAAATAHICGGATQAPTIPAHKRDFHAEFAKDRRDRRTDA